MTETIKLKVINQAPTQPKKVEQNCSYTCECKQCERCSKCDYIVNRLRYFREYDGRLYCEKCLPTKQNLITLKGFTTSRVEQALKANNPYPARVFLKLDCVDCHNTKELCQALTPKHRKCEECTKQKCRKCEIPVFFRIKEKDNWIKPSIKKGSYLEVQGYFSNLDKERKSFTATSYQLLNQEFNQQILSHGK